VQLILCNSYFIQINCAQATPARHGQGNNGKRARDVMAHGQGRHVTRHVTRQTPWSTCIRQRPASTTEKEGQGRRAEKPKVKGLARLPALPRHSLRGPAPRKRRPSPRRRDGQSVRQSAPRARPRAPCVQGPLRSR
jgi:hypothetical protein